MRSKWILLLAVVFFVVVACNKQETTTTDTATTDTSATGTTGTETTGTTSTTSTGSTGGGASSLNAEDKDFVMKAALGGMTEVTLGQLAASKAVGNDVKDFGNRMVSDHGKANDELKALATTKGLALPTELDTEHKKTVDALSAKSSKAFDRAYIDDMVKDHEEDVAEFKKASASVTDPDLKSWVTKTLPTLEDHLKMAKQVASKTK